MRCSQARQMKFSNAMSGEPEETAEESRSRFMGKKFIVSALVVIVLLVSAYYVVSAYGGSVVQTTVVTGTITTIQLPVVHPGCGACCGRLGRSRAGGGASGGRRLYPDLRRHLGRLNVNHPSVALQHRPLHSRSDGQARRPTAARRAAPLLPRRCLQGPAFAVPERECLSDDEFLVLKPLAPVRRRGEIRLSVAHSGQLVLRVTALRAFEWMLKSRPGHHPTSLSSESVLVESLRWCDSAAESACTDLPVRPDR